MSADSNLVWNFNLVVFPWLAWLYWRILYCSLGVCAQVVDVTIMLQDWKILYLLRGNCCYWNWKHLNPLRSELTAQWENLGSKRLVEVKGISEFNWSQMTSAAIFPPGGLFGLFREFSDISKSGKYWWTPCIIEQNRALQVSWQWVEFRPPLTKCHNQNYYYSQLPCHSHM